MNRCDRCILWDYNAGNYGTCKAASDSFYNSHVEIIVKSDTNEHEIETRLETSRDFSCVLFEDNGDDE